MRNRKQEKPKDLVGTWKKLLGYCRKYLVILVIALVCAAAGTVCTLVGPDKLSDMTDAVTSGISPDTDKLQEISTAMSENIAANMQTVITEIAGNLSDTENMQMEIEVNGQVISFEDQRMTMEIFASLDGADDTQKSEAVQKLPDAVKKALYTDITVDKTVITGAEQLEMTNLMAEAGDDTDSMLAVFDKLPDSVYQLIKPAIDMDKVFHIGIVLVILYACSYVPFRESSWQRLPRKCQNRCVPTFRKKSTVCRCGFTTGQQPEMYYPALPMMWIPSDSP